jgi:phage baseplate assembly protein V
MSPPAELERRIANLIRYGTIAAVDHGAVTVRVNLGEITTGAVRWASARAGTTTTWSPPTVGEQVMLVSPNGDLSAGTAIVGLYSDAHPSPSSSPDEHVVNYPDGARTTYNHATGDLRLTGIRTVTVQAAEHLTIECPDSDVMGNLVVHGLLTYKAGLAGHGGTVGNTITGPLIQVDGELSSNGVVLETHVHTNSGGNGTGGPPA